MPMLFKLHFDSENVGYLCWLGNLSEKIVNEINPAIPLLAAKMPDIRHALTFNQKLR